MTLIPGVNCPPLFDEEGQPNLALASQMGISGDDLERLKNMSREYMRLQEVAALCDVTVRAVQQWVQDGKLVARHAGGRTLIAKDVLADFMARPHPRQLS